MKIDKEALEKIAHLSRLYFDGKNEEDMLKSMNDILDWMDKLNEIDTSNVAPLRHMTEEVNVLREDHVENILPREKGLLVAPEKNEAYFRVPKVID